MILDVKMTRTPGNYVKEINMEPKKEKIESSLIQRILNPQPSAEEAQTIIVNSSAVLEWLEEQAKESVRGRVHDKPRWSE